jgi:hypothetical protein
VLLLGGKPIEEITVLDTLTDENKIQLFLKIQSEDLTQQ